MFHACVQKFDVMDKKILGGKLNRALVCATVIIKVYFLLKNQSIYLVKNYYVTLKKYSLRLKKTVVVDFQTSCLTICFIKTFYINIIYFDMTYLIIRGTLIMFYLF